jgi:hypothetical protein
VDTVVADNNAPRHFVVRRKSWGPQWLVEKQHR